MNKKAKVVLNILILILISIIVFLVLRNFLLDKKLKDEITETYNLIIMDDYNYKDVYEKIDNIVTKEGYAIVEDSAKDYLSVMAFSKQGLIEQLEYEGYSEKEAQYGADNCGAN